jgi:phosphate transport system permease protein
MPTFTGLLRTRQTSRLVAFSDSFAKAAITVGGIATIVAVATVCLFLVWVGLPLLRGGDATPLDPVGRGDRGPLLQIAEDPYRHLGWLLGDDGTLTAFAFKDGKAIETRQLFTRPAVRCLVRQRDRVLLGRADGQLQFCRVDFDNTVSSGADTPQAAALAPGAVLVDGPRLFERTPEGQWRLQQLQVQIEEPTSLGGTAAVEHCDFAESANAMLVAAVTADGMLHFKRRTTRHDLLLDEDIVELTGASKPLTGIVPDLGDAKPDHVLLTGAGDSVFLIWNDGRLLRLDTRDRDAPQLAERLHLLPAGRRITCVGFLIGKTTLLVGDDQGDVAAWFCTKPPDAATVDGATLVRARVFAPASPSPVVALHASSRGRLFVAGHADGRLRVWQGTSEQLVADVRLPTGTTLVAAALSPKDDGILAASTTSLHRWDLHPGHHEVTLASAFRPVWYEGAVGPAHAWQSTGGTDDFEPKLGLWPLIYGTLKATFYCLLFGVPLALLAAIYTSEFLHARSRARIKPLIELMASLPSVVLGFLAGIVFAPVVAEHLVAVLLAIPVIPFVLLTFAQLWQQAPPWLRPTCERLRVPAALLAVPMGIYLAVQFAPTVESLLFAGDFKDWLAVATRAADDPGRGSAFGGWLLLSIPLAAMAAMFVTARLASGWRGDTANLRRFGFGTVAAVAIGCGLSALLSGIGLDLRDSLFGTFDPRNSLVVGLAMGFAVVPIIYTIAEDALSAVPDHLRAASLGAGATPWQTAVRVIFPTAMSGVFSAVMIGLGRAVGETMIVVMAVGGTPIMDISVFNGFRTLSANIATELPEAVRNSSHYRMLYLAALCLFAMTFVLNTAAEVVRQRFRKRAYQL